MEQWQTAAVALLVLVVGIFLRGEHLRLTEQGRLHNRISAELDMLAKLPEGGTRDALRGHIEAQVRYLIAQDAPDSLQEHFALRWDVPSVLAAAAVVAYVVIEDFGSSGPVGRIGIAIAAIMVVLVLWRLTTVLSARRVRRWQRLRAARSSVQPAGDS